MISQTLFKPNVSNLLTKLDDSHSMFSIATRDFVDNSGRTVMEYRRSRHGGRERLIEEFLTTLVWGFGIKFMKERIYDPLARRLTRIQFPDMDMDILKRGGSQEVTQELLNKLENLAGQDTAAGKHAKQYWERFGGLKNVVGHKSLQGVYHSSNVAKFVLCTAIPVLLISLGIPTFNQWLTRVLHQKETAQKGPYMQSPSGSPTLEKPLSFARPHAFDVFDGLGGVPGAAPLAAGVRFSGLGSHGTKWVSDMLQNERNNSLIIDGLLSGGRTYKARNWVERLEIIFKEASIIYFLFFAQRPIQNFFQSWTDRLGGAVSGLEFNTLRHLHEGFKGTSRNFAKEYQAGLTELTQELLAARPSLARTLGTDASTQLKALLAQPTGKTSGAVGVEVEKALVDVIRNYMIEGRQGNLIVDTLQTSGNIPTLRAGREGILLDLTKKINAQGLLKQIGTMHQMAQNLLGGSQGMKHASGAMEALLKKSMTSRTSAWFGANAVCALFLSYLCPKIQHYITYKTTGKDYFPGVDA